MEEWIHCNRCGRMAATDRSIKYFMTECQNVLCGNCIGNYGQKCGKCPTTVCRSIELNANTRQDIQICFKDITKSLKQLIQVSQFQTSQHKQLVNKMTAKTTHLTQQCHQYQQHIERQDNDMKTLTDQMTRLQEECKNGRQTTHNSVADPITRPFSSLFSLGDSGHNSPMDINGNGSITSADPFKLRQPQNQNFQPIGHQFNDFKLNPMSPITTCSSANLMLSPLAVLSTANSCHRQPVIDANKSMSSANHSDNPIDSVRHSKISVRNHLLNRRPIGNPIVAKVVPSSQSYGLASASSRINLVPNSAQMQSRPAVCPPKLQSYAPTLSVISSATSRSGQMTIRSKPSVYSSVVSYDKLYGKNGRNS